MAVLISEYSIERKLDVLDVARGLPEWFTSEGLIALERSLDVDSGFVAIDGGRVVGFVLYFVSRDMATISWMGVLPEKHRGGIGHLLLQRLEEALVIRQISKVRVSTLGESVVYAPYEITRAFYRKLGFVNRESVRHEDNPSYQEELILEKDLVLAYGKIVLEHQETLDSYEKWDRLGVWLRSPISLWRRLRSLF